VNFFGRALLCRTAFDSVDHHVLLDELEYYSIRGIAHEWFSSFLSNRNQFVSLGYVESATEQILCGVPQGSVLGIFLLYVNDLHKCSSELDFSPSLLTRSKLAVCLDLKLNEELDKVNQWLQLHRLYV